MNTTSSASTQKYMEMIGCSASYGATPHSASSDTSMSFKDVLAKAQFSSINPNLAISDDPKISDTVDANTLSNMYIRKNTWYDRALKLGEGQAHPRPMAASSRRSNTFPGNPPGAARWK